MANSPNQYGIDEAHIEEWEIVRVKPRNPQEQGNDVYDYVLLHKERRVTLWTETLLNSHTLSITMLPIVRVDGNYMTPFNGYKQKTWIAHANFWEQQIDFAHEGYLKITPELQGRGLGSCVFSALILWAKRYHPNFRVKSLSLSANDAFEDEARDRRNEFYRRLGFTLIFSDAEERSGSAVAATASVLCENRNSAKVESVSLEDFMRDMFRRNSELNNQVKWLESNANRLITEERIEFKKEICKWQLISGLLFLAALVAAFR